MKIDNKWFLFMLQKKKKGGMVLPVLLCVCLVTGLLGSGFVSGFLVAGLGQFTPDTVNAEEGIGSFAALRDEELSNPADSTEEIFVEGEYVTTSYLAELTKEKYKDEISPYGYTYGPAITGLTRHDPIVIQLGFNPYELGIENWTEIINLYENPELTSAAGPSSWEYDKTAGTLTLYPSNYARGLVWVSMLSTDVVRKYVHDDITFFPYDAGKDWGNLGTYYLTSYVDLQTGEKLTVPQVQIVTLKGELEDTPRLEYSFTDDGRVQLDWTKVSGADEYFICEIEYDEENGYSIGMRVIGVTNETEWISDAPDYGSSTTNTVFRNYQVAQEDWYQDWCREDRIAQYGEEPVFVFDTKYRGNYCVIGVSEEGTSMMSNCIDILDIQANLPVSIATETWQANGFNYGSYEKVEDLQPYSYITMADGSTCMKLIDYDTANAMVVEERYIITDEDGNYIEGKNIEVLKVPYRIEGTPFEDAFLIADYAEENLEDDLAFLEEREELLRKRAGDIALSTDIEFEEEEDVVETEVRQAEFEITANSALSEYLALNMLSGVRIIDVSEFPEAADESTLSDALLEAYYQNPLILGISGYKTNKEGTAVKVVYDSDAAKTVKKQEEIKIKVAEIVSEIITDDMTELEKELAINEYLCNTCVYDDDALKNAEENNFYYVDSEFDDSFTAYGALINGRCVCAGYAAAFKLLADASGLDAVVVTGVLDGNLPHAWNKVRVDGEWMILDVTNNDTEFLVNALLNLPDEAGKRTLTEDSDYVLDGCMRNYVATNGQREFYRINGLYFDYEEVSEELIIQLTEDGTALLRTEYELDDETFDRIAGEVYEGLYEDAELYGYYWMGVIYLELE